MFREKKGKNKKEKKKKNAQCCKRAKKNVHCVKEERKNEENEIEMNGIHPRTRKRRVGPQRWCSTSKDPSFGGDVSWMSSCESVFPFGDRGWSFDRGGGGCGGNVCGGWCQQERGGDDVCKSGEKV